MSSEIYDAIIVGSGISGLAAAKWLKDNNLSKVLVLEARNRVGGRTYTKRDPKVNWVDLGGSYVGPTQDHLLRIAKELGVETFLVNEVEDLVYFKNEKRYTFRYNELPALENGGQEELAKLLIRLDELGENISIREPWTSPNAVELDSMTFKEFLDKEFSCKGVRDFGHLVHNAFLAAGAHECSLLFMVWYIKQAFGTRRIFSTTNGGQERKFHGGSQLISEGLAEKIGRENIRFGSAVNRIDHHDDYVMVSTLDNQVFKSRHVIIAMSPCLIPSIYFEPALDPLKAQLYQRMPMGSVIKTIVYYEKAWWKDLNMCGTLMVDGDGDEEESPVEYTFDDSKPDGSKPAIMGFILASRARKLRNLTPEERCDRICKSYAKGFGSDEALRFVHYEECDWQAQQFSSGCYTGVCPPGVVTAYWPYLRKPHGRVFFAGTETATVWSGYMNGAVEAGERAAREVLAERGLIKRDEIWRDEPESKDLPHKPFEDIVFK
ncbi:hypothetical protein HA402_001447 [Bradysia odoriphaga]|nr:hypothetical protein HA402_001447 [Bradysia odoriphaga]